MYQVKLQLNRCILVINMSCRAIDTSEQVVQRGLIRFYGISTIAGYLMPNPVYTYIRYMIYKQSSFL